MFVDNSPPSARGPVRPVSCRRAPRSLVRPYELEESAYLRASPVGMRQPPGRDPALTLSRTAPIIERDRHDRFPRKAGEHHLDWSCHAGGTHRAPLRRDDRATVLCSNRLRPNRPHTGLQSEPLGVWGRHRSLRARRYRSARDLQRVRRGAAHSRSRDQRCARSRRCREGRAPLPSGSGCDDSGYPLLEPGQGRGLGAEWLSCGHEADGAHPGGRAGVHPARYRDRPRRRDAAHPRGRDAGDHTLSVPASGHPSGPGSGG